MNLSIMVKNYKGKVCNMYQDEYKRWLAADLEDADLKPELAKAHMAEVIEVMELLAQDVTDANAYVRMAELGNALGQ